MRLSYTIERIIGAIAIPWLLAACSGKTEPAGIAVTASTSQHVAFPDDVIEVAAAVTNRGDQPVEISRAWLEVRDASGSILIFGTFICLSGSEPRQHVGAGATVVMSVRWPLGGSDCTTPVTAGIYEVRAAVPVGANTWNYVYSAPITITVRPSGEQE